MRIKHEHNDYYGLCPECHGEPVILNVGKAHVAMCEEHRARWDVGWNLFSNWQYETQADWSKNAALLERCREVKPYYHPTPPPDPGLKHEQRCLGLALDLEAALSWYGKAISDQVESLNIALAGFIGLWPRSAVDAIATSKNVFIDDEVRQESATAADGAAKEMRK